MRMICIRPSKGKHSWNPNNGFLKKWHAGISKGVIFVRVDVHLKKRRMNSEKRHTMTIIENENDMYKAK